MWSKSTSFIVAVVVASTALFGAQIYAPLSLRPLTPRLLAYPHTIPTVLSTKGLARLKLAPSATHPLTLPTPLRQPLIAAVGSCKFGPEDCAAIAKDTGAKPTTVKEIRETVYKEKNGDEEFRYGYQVAPTQTYVNQENGKTCSDGGGTISGTYCAPNGERYNVNVDATNQAAAEFNQAVAEKVADLKPEEILDLVGYSQNVEAATSQVVASAMLGETVSQAQEVTSKILTYQADVAAKTEAIRQTAKSETTQAVVGGETVYTLTTTYTDPETGKIADQTVVKYTIEVKRILERDPELGTIYHDTTYYREVGTNKLLDATTISYLQDVDTRTFKTAGRASGGTVEYVTLSSATKTDVNTGQILETKQLYHEVSAAAPDFSFTSTRETTFAGDGTSNTTIEQKKYFEEKQAAARYADPKVETKTLARYHCGDNQTCLSNFTREQYLSPISTDKSLITQAKAVYAQTLFDLTLTLGDPATFASLPPATQKQIKDTNTQLQQAYQVYMRENIGRLKADDLTQYDLALELSKLLEDNPTLLDQYVAKYTHTPNNYALYNPDRTVYSFPSSSTPNALTVALVESIRRGAAIPGLYENNTPLSYGELAPAYKNQVRDKACQSTSDNTYSLCLKRDQLLGSISSNASSPTALDDLQSVERALDALIADSTDPLIKQLIDQQKGSNIKFDFYYGNLASIDNPNVAPELRSQAIANAVINTNTNVAVSRGHGPIPKTILENPSKLSSEQIKIANEYLDRQLVTETYNMGGGLAAGIAGFTAGMGLCAATGIGAAVSPLCGAIGGLAGWGASQVPLYQMTATDYQAHKDSISSNALTSGVVTSLYSNQGAAGDEGLGRSVTTRDNRYALMQTISYSLGTTPLSSLASDPLAQGNLAIQAQSLNQWEVFQNRQEAWTWASAPIAMATGALNVGVGKSLATHWVDRAVTNVGRTKFLADATLFTAGTTLNQAQAYAQFETTSGDASLLSTPTQREYQACVLTLGEAGCGAQLQSLNAETDAYRNLALQQAFVTDGLMQLYQTSFAVSATNAEFKATTAMAKSLGVETASRPIGEIRAEVDSKLTGLSKTLGIHPNDVRNLAQNQATILQAMNKKAGAVSVALNADLTVIKKLDLTPIQNAEGKFRLTLPDDAATPAKEAVNRLNLLAEDIELANGHPLTQEQATILATAPDIETGVKSVTPGGGKTSYIVLIEHAKKHKSVYTGANKTDTLEAINTMLKSPEGRAYAKKRLGEVFYIEEDGTIYKVNLDEAVFDPNATCTTSQSWLIPTAHAACSADSGTIISSAEFDQILADPERIVSIYGTHNGMAWGAQRRDAQRTSWGQKILYGDYDTSGQGFHIIVDEGAKDALGSVAISGDPELITKSKIGQNTIATLDELLKLDSIKGILDRNTPTPLAKVKNQDNFTLSDPVQKTRLLRELAGQALDQIESEQNSLWGRLTHPKPSETDLLELKNLITRMDTALSQNDPTLLSQAQGDFDTFLKRPTSSVVDSVSTRATLAADILNQMGMNENDFDLSRDGTTILLKQAKGETGQTYSSVGQQLVLYEIGKLMLQARGEDITKLPSRNELTISVTKSQMTLKEWYQKNYRAGNSHSFLDGTGRVLKHLGLGGMQGEEVKLPVDSAINRVNNYQNESDFATRFGANVAKEADKMHLLVLSDTQLGFDQVTNQIRSAQRDREVLIAQYNTGGEEFIHFEKGIGGKKTVYTTKAEWEAKLHELASKKSSNGSSLAGEALVIIQGRDRALDISVETDFLHMRWHNDLPRESIGTTSIQDSATQGVFRNRVFVDRTRDALIQKLVDSGMSPKDAAQEVDAAKQFHVYTHESLGLKSNLIAELPSILADQHAQHLNTIRLQDTLTTLGDSHKNAIDILSRKGGDLQVTNNRAFKAFIEANKIEGQRLQDIYKREITNKPLTNPNEIAIEIYVRGKREDARLRALLTEVEAKLKLNTTQVEKLSKLWGIDQEYPSFELFTTKLNEITTDITPRNFETPAKMFSPGAEVMYWATNSSTHPNTPPQYRVPTEAFIQSTAVRKVTSSTASARTAPVDITPPPTNPLAALSRVITSSPNQALTQYGVMLFHNFSGNLYRTPAQVRLEEAPLPPSIQKYVDSMNTNPSNKDRQINPKQISDIVDRGNGKYSFIYKGTRYGVGADGLLDGGGVQVAPTTPLAPILIPGHITLSPTSPRLTFTELKNEETFNNLTFTLNNGHTITITPTLDLEDINTLLPPERSVASITYNNQLLEYGRYNYIAPTTELTRGQEGIGTSADLQDQDRIQLAKDPRESIADWMARLNEQYQNQNRPRATLILPQDPLSGLDEILNFPQIIGNLIATDQTFNLLKFTLENGKTLLFSPASRSDRFILNGQEFPLAILDTRLPKKTSVTAITYNGANINLDNYQSPDSASPPSKVTFSTGENLYITQQANKLGKQIAQPLKQLSPIDSLPGEPDLSTTIALGTYNLILPPLRWAHAPAPIFPQLTPLSPTSVSLGNIEYALSEPISVDTHNTTYLGTGENGFKAVIKIAHDSPGAYDQTLAENTYLIEMAGNGVPLGYGLVHDLSNPEGSAIGYAHEYIPPEISTDSKFSLINPSPLITDEAKYLAQISSKAPRLTDLYKDPVNFANNYQKDLETYIEPNKSASLTPIQRLITLGHSITPRKLEILAEQAKRETKRLYQNMDKRNDPAKLTIIDGYIDNYLKYIAEAQADGSLPQDFSFADLQTRLMHNLHSLTYQDYVDSENLLGDHGLRHLVQHNITVTIKILNQAKARGVPLKGIHYLMAIEVQTHHDEGYSSAQVRSGVELATADPSYIGIDVGHNLLSAQIYRQQLSNTNNPLYHLFSNDQLKTMHTGILWHDDSTVDLLSSVDDAITSAIHIADNTHAFETKLPEILFGYPDSLKALRLLKTVGAVITDKTEQKTIIDQIVSTLITSIQNHPTWGLEDKKALIKAARALNPIQAKFNVGRISGQDPQFTVDDRGHVTITAEVSESARLTTVMFGLQQYDQLAKFIADLTGRPKADILVDMGNNVLSFGNDKITIQAVVTPKSTQILDNLTNLLNSDADFTNFYLEDNLDALSQAVTEAKLKQTPDDQKLLAELAEQQSSRLERLQKYLSDNP